MIVSLRLFLSKVIYNHSVSRNLGSSNSKDNGYNISAITNEDLTRYVSARNFAELDINQFEEIYRDDTTGTTKKKIEKILDEYENIKYNTEGKVPSTLSVKDMDRILNEAQTESQRKNVINFLFAREIAKFKYKAKNHDKGDYLKLKRQALTDMMNSKSEESSGQQSDRKTGLVMNNKLHYGLWHNSLLMRVTKRAIMQRTQSNLINSSMYGPKIVYDMSFETAQEPRELRGVAEQIMMSYSINRFDYKGAFDLWLCGYKEGDRFDSVFKRIMGNINDTMISLKPECFTHYFDKSRIIMLSPNAEKYLEDDIGKNDNVYVIGGIVDVVNKQVPHTFRKAQRLGIKVRKLPIDTNIAWKSGTKSLCINHVTNILLELYKGSDWKTALEVSIPKRKMKTLDQLNEEEQSRRKKYVLKELRSIEKPISLFKDR